jgi:cell division transport system ATP-binding protein
MFKAFNQVGVTVLIATHDLSMIDRLGARRLHLAHGRLTA